MKVTKLYTGNDGKSYFEDMQIEYEYPHQLGKHSKIFPTTGLLFRDFDAHLFFDWHNAPQHQYIIYLEGEVEVRASGGEIRIFKSGDILFATDLTGEGHATRTLTKGRSVIIVSG